MRDTDCDRVSYFVAPREGPVRTLSDLRNRTLATGAIDSPQATLIPLGRLRRDGLDPAADLTVRRFDVLVGKHGDHVGGERDAFECLRRGEAAACAMLDLNSDGWTKDGTIDPGRFTVVAETARFDHGVFTVRQDLEADAERRWLDALFAMRYDNPAHREMMDLEGLKAVTFAARIRQLKFRASRADSSGMRRVFTLPMPQAAIVALAVGGLLTLAAPVSAQGVGVGARLAWVKPDVDLVGDVDVDAVRFIGGQVRLLSGRAGFEVSLDHHSETFELLNQKVTETPIQASLLLRLGKGRVAPFLLGGPGWYRRKIEPLDGPDVSVSTTEFGWHAGVGLEILPSKHFGIHGDYRYTFIDFDKKEDEGFIGGLLPGHRGSMWTLGATVYF